MINVEEMKSLSDDYIKAKAVFDEVKSKLDKRIDDITQVYNSIEGNIGTVERWDIVDVGGVPTIETINTHAYYGDYCETFRYIPFDDLKYDVLHKNGSATKEWDILADIIKQRVKEEEKRRKAAQKRAKRIQKKQKEEAEREEYERLKKKFEKVK